VSHPTQSENNGERWYDSSKVIAALFAAVFVFVLAWAGVVYAMSHAAELKNVEQDGRINAITEKLEKIDSNVGKILDRLQK
jgi:Tfp pilus assembly protein PilO